MSAEEVANSEIFFEQSTSQWVQKQRGSPRPVPAGNYNLVMDPEGRIFVVPRRGAVHSAVLWGNDVGAAGMINFGPEGKMGI